MKRNRSIILLSILAIIFFIIGFVVRDSAEGILFDKYILEQIHNNRNPMVFKIMKLISFIGSEKFLFPVVGMLIIYMLIKKKYYISKILLINSLGSSILNNLFKQIFSRTRPLEFMQVKQGGLSYPSGHSMVTMSLYLSIAYILSKDIEDLNKKRKIYICSIIYIFLMGISRLYLGVHWPTDIIGGYIMGYILYYLSIKILK
ncbi:phosphatase PAP2 family protein [Wansuia hejianensis]|uniref:Phosphatase PAP2 family protein n=1 Tax=Wansuia hejianensis TaxID=2763667 RepID=A0A926F014_9FIRM|nr:phosphatase PAP2 family protein [Wansuia hejianensis]MBC8591545.1 phosphatase PAP2 family protein [Wansuia hejianensis]